MALVVATLAGPIAVLPATATVIDILVLTQIPSVRELAGVSLVIVAVALYREREAAIVPTPAD